MCTECLKEKLVESNKSRQFLIMHMCRDIDKNRRKLNI
jgi:hypothetical protein